MIQNLDQIAGKIKTIKEEMDVVEYRVINTRTHVETIEDDMKKLSKGILEGFHSVSAKVNSLEEVILKLEKKIDSIDVK